MEPLDSPAIDQAALVAALEAEAAYERIWLPPEPWWNALLAEKEDVAGALLRRLRRGGRWTRSEIVDTRKPGHGIRPVSVMSPEVRIAYRAIVSEIIVEEHRADRSAAKYAEFVTEPIRAAYDNGAGLRRFGDAKYAYVLTTDVTAFYQYIDHAILRDELDLIAADIELVDGLAGLLGDMEGRGFGIPQRSAPSDWLSELCGARIVRWIVRDGFDVWRYNDDFRVGCRTYSEALQAIESLSRACRDIGLVLNDQKTATYSFIRYVMNVANVEIDDTTVEFDPSDVEASVSSEYPPDDDDQAVTEAGQTIARLWDRAETPLQPTDEPWDLRELTAEQHRAVRRALNTLTKHKSVLAVPSLLSMLSLQPAITHRIIRYAEAVSSEDGWDPEFYARVIARLSLNEWQRAWVAYGIRACNVSVGDGSPLADWLVGQVVTRPNSLAAAESAVTLASSGLIDFQTLDGYLRQVGPDFAVWYVHAVGILNGAGSVSSAQIGALRQASPINAAILR
jgi:hypothetical protein